MSACLKSLQVVCELAFKLAKIQLNCGRDVTFPSAQRTSKFGEAGVVVRAAKVDGW